MLVRNKKEGAKVIRYLEALMASDENFPKFDIISEDSLLISRSDAVVNIISRLRMLSDVDVVSDKRKRSSREIAVMLNDYESIHASGIAPDKALLSAIERMKRGLMEGMAMRMREALPERHCHSMALILYRLSKV